MIAVIFEVIPAPGRKQEYLDLAEKLRSALEKLDGFISIERFESLTNQGKILSLSIWRDEEAGSPPLVTADLVYVNVSLATRRPEALPDDLRGRVREYERTVPVET